MNDKVVQVVEKSGWRFWAPLLLGVFMLLNTLVWIVINGGRWFEPVPPGELMPEYWNDLNRVFGGFYMLFYFTIQTNVFAGIMLILFAFKSFSPKIQSIFSGSVFLISITFLIYWLAIAPFKEAHLWTNVYYMFYNLFVHMVNPLLSIVVFLLFRKEMRISKDVIGKMSYYMAIYCAMHAVFYGVGAMVDPATGEIVGATVYSFLDLQKILFMNLKDHMALAWFINLIVLLISPLILITISWTWIKITKVETSEKSYYIWMDKIKNWNKEKQFKN